MRSPFSASKFSPVSTEWTRRRRRSRRRRIYHQDTENTELGKNKYGILCAVLLQAAVVFGWSIHHFLVSPSRESESAVHLSDFSLWAKLWCHSARRRAFTSTILCRTGNRCLGWPTFVGVAAAKVGLRVEEDEADPRSLFVIPPAASPRLVWFDKSLRPTFSKSPLISPE
jgi:hypothetical protein